MNVGSYIFQSPYSSSVQVGRPDPSVKKEDSSAQSGNSSFSAINPTVQEAQTLQATQTQEVKPTVESAQLLDIYA